MFKDTRTECRVYSCTRQQRSHDKMKQRLEDILSVPVPGGFINDDEVYDKLREYYQNLPKSDYKPEAKFPVSHHPKNNRRVDELWSVLPDDFKARVSSGSNLHLLDMGCSEGFITAAFGERLCIPVERRIGADVRDISSTDDFVFKLLEEGAPLEFADNSFDIVLIMMVLHHVTDPKQMLEDLFRVIKPGGILLLREHDCSRPELAMALDIMHGLYVHVFPPEPEYSHFSSTYRAVYRSR
jgi:2-polyprenyl-3-methyl-5-hydroxy-6-metoxy-1,4-benzoquinol methylase